MQPYPRLMRAFALLDVLVAVAALLVLATLGYALGDSGRERLRQGTCVSHLRQIGQALIVYRDDYDDRDALYFLPRGLWPLYPSYVRDCRIFRCPNDPTDYSRLSSPYFPISYLYQYILDPHDHPDIVWRVLYPRRGNNYPVVVDKWHWTSPENLVPWIVLRMDGRVEVSQKRVRDSVDL